MPRIVAPQPNHRAARQSRIIGPQASGLRPSIIPLGGHASLATVPEFRPSNPCPGPPGGYIILAAGPGPSPQQPTLEAARPARISGHRPRACDQVAHSRVFAQATHTRGLSAGTHISPQASDCHPSDPLTDRLAGTPFQPQASELCPQRPTPGAARRARISSRRPRIFAHATHSRIARLARIFGRSASLAAGLRSAPTHL